MRALVRNLLGGLRLFAFLPVDPSRFSPSPRQAVSLAAIALGAWIALERVPLAAGAEIDWGSVHQVVAVSALTAAVLVMLAPRHAGATAMWTTAVASAMPFLALLAALLNRASPPDWSGRVWVFAVTFAVMEFMEFIVFYRALRLAAPSRRVTAALRAALVVLIVGGPFGLVLYGDVELWVVPEPEEIAEEPETPGDAERTLFRQPDLVDAALSQVASGTPGTTDTFFVGFAGFGSQGVFDKEVRFARAALAERIDLAGRTLELINTPEPDAEIPLATMSGLRRGLGGIAARMNLDEDVLVLFLTSHGGADAELSVVQGPLPLEPLRGGELRKALDESGIRWRIVLISACHSGSFIPHLEDTQTLVATAARADRKSLGCSEERELTYFGEALFRDALPESADLLSALARARGGGAARARGGGARERTRRAAGVRGRAHAREARRAEVSPGGLVARGTAARSSRGRPPNG